MRLFAPTAPAITLVPRVSRILPDSGEGNKFSEKLMDTPKLYARYDIALDDKTPIRRGATQRTHSNDLTPQTPPRQLARINPNSTTPTSSHTSRDRDVARVHLPSSGSEGYTPICTTPMLTVTESPSDSSNRKATPKTTPSPPSQRNTSTNSNSTSQLASDVDEVPTTELGPKAARRRRSRMVLASSAFPSPVFYAAHSTLALYTAQGCWLPQLHLAPVFYAAHSTLALYPAQATTCYAFNKQTKNTGRTEAKRRVQGCCSLSTDRLFPPSRPAIASCPTPPARRDRLPVPRRGQLCKFFQERSHRLLGKRQSHSHSHSHSRSRSHNHSHRQAQPSPFGEKSHLKLTNCDQTCSLQSLGQLSLCKRKRTQELPPSSLWSLDLATRCLTPACLGLPRFTGEL
eukprot:g69127.t1